MPEERNRILTDHLSSLLFAPTDTAERNLMDELVTGEIINSGDISVEVVREAWKYSRRSSILKEIGLRSKSFILFTMHRAESTDSYTNLKTILKVFQDLGKRKFNWSTLTKSKSDDPEDDNNDSHMGWDGMGVVFPIHPRTEKFLKSYGLYEDLVKTSNVTFYGLSRNHIR